MKTSSWIYPSTVAVGRGSITVVALLLTFPRFLLLPGLAGAFLAPISVVSSAASRSSAPSSSAASSGGSKAKPSPPTSSPGRRPATSETLFSAAKNTDNFGDGDDDPESFGEREAIMTPPLPPQQQQQLQQQQDRAVTTATASSTITSRQFPPPPREKAKTVASARLNCNTSGKNDVGMEAAGASRVGVAMKVAAREEEAEARSGFVETDAAVVRKGEGEGATIRLWNLPNVLTVARIITIPIFAVVFYSGLRRRNVWCAAIFSGAALTDWLDGYIARTRGLETPFGAFLDPVADKLMVSTALILLCERLGPWMTICSAIILCRELAVSALREWMAQLGMRDMVKVGNAGKWKTATQMVAVGLLLLLEPGAAVTLVDPVAFMPPARALLYVSTVLTVTSGSGYLIAAWPTLIGRPPRKG